MQSVADFPLNLYFQDEQGVYVNLYAGSELRWKPNGISVKLTQKTAYPESERIEFRIDPVAPVEFSLRLRIPAWLKTSAAITVNGKAAGVPAKPGSFAVLTRRWRTGDTIQLELPFPSRAVPIEARVPDTVASMRGPVLLVAIDPPANLAMPSAALAQMEPVPGQPLEFDCETATGPVRMRPFYRVQHELYTTYFRQS